MVSPSSREHSAVSTSTLPHSYGQAILPTSSPISLATTTTLSAPSFQDSFKKFSFLHFPVHFVLDSPSIFLSSPPSYSDSLCSLSTSASMNRPSFSSSYTLTSSLPSSLPPPYPIYRPLPIYASPRGTSSSMGSISHLYSTVLSTNTLSMSHYGGPSTMVSSVSSRPIFSGSKKKATRNWARNWLRSWPKTTLTILPGDNVLDLLLLVVPYPEILSFFPYFPLGPTPLSIISQMIL